MEQTWTHMGLSSSPEGKGALPERGGGGQLVAMLVKRQVISHLENAKDIFRCIYLATSLT